MLTILLEVFFTIVVVVFTWFCPKDTETFSENDIMELKTGLIAICILMIAITVIDMGFNHIDVEQQISQNQIKYEALIAEIEAVDTDNEDVSKVQVIKDVMEWNQYVQSKKYYAANPWRNWFYSQKLVDKLQYIEVPEWNINEPN